MAPLSTSSSILPMFAYLSKRISLPENIRVTTGENLRVYGQLEHMGSTALKVTRLVLYLTWTLSLMPLQLLGLALHRRWVTTLPLFYHRWCCRILGFQVRVIGTPACERPALFAANHVSYTDIAILGSLIPGSFVAKDEVANWPLFGWLAKLQRTVFVDRRIGSAAAQRDAISQRLASGDALILFPEGTSGDGNRTLPFKSALFGAAEDSGNLGGIVVQPVSLAYARLDGMPIGRWYRPFFAWHGSIGLMAHLWSMIGLGKLEIIIQFHPGTFLSDCGSRKALAAYCQARIAGGMAGALSGRPQPMPKPPAEAASSPNAMAELPRKAA
jgi:lyso-ornithine lipid O-acyltransferase